MIKNLLEPNISRIIRILDIGLLLIALLGTFCTAPPSDQLDNQLTGILREHNITALESLETPDPALIKLGQALFFDPELSGNRDISCATCHHPNFATGDALPVSAGTGGAGLGHQRVFGAGRDPIPRNAPAIFNLNSNLWTSMFWDSRVAGNAQTGFLSPAGSDLPPDLDNVIAAQAMFPVTSAAEMRGTPGDRDIFGNPNEIAIIAEDNLPLTWEALLTRLLAIPGYVDLFQASYPEIAPENLGFQHVANAIAAFEMSAYTFTDGPWDRYVAGDKKAINEQAKRGALLFYGSARCARCHRGSLLTDQLHHNIGVPQLGPGKGAEAPLDHGRYRETWNVADRFAFRTPPLRNVALTAPYMHNGAYTTLEAAVRHHLNAERYLYNYDPSQLPQTYQQIYQSDLVVQDQIAKAMPLLNDIDPLIKDPIVLTEAEFQDLMAFLDALTSPSAVDLSETIPDSVPSGLKVER